MKIHDARCLHLLTRLTTALLILGSATSVSAALTAAQEGWIQDRIESGELVGLVIVSISDGSMQSRTFGRASLDSPREPAASDQFEIGSITKAFTNLLLAELVVKGDVAYNTTVAEIMTDQEFDNPDVGRITLLELATHTSGLPRLPSNLAPDDQSDPYAEYDITALQAGVRTTRDGQRLTKTYAYSNFGVGLLGYLLGVVDGGGFEQAMVTHVLKPLGMRTATFDDSASLVPGHHAGAQTSHWHFTALSGAGSLRSSGEELALVLRPWLSGEQSGLKHDVSADLEIAAVAGGGINVTRVWHTVGDGERRVFWHNGGTGGFSSFVGFNPRTGQGRVVLSNSDYDVTEFGLGLLGASLVRPEDESRDRTNEKQDLYADYHGHFAISPDFVLSVFEIRGQLVVQATGQQPLRLAPNGEDEFTLTDVDARLTFERDESGAVERAILHQNGQVMPAKRVASPVAATTFDEIQVDAETIREYVGSYELAPGAIFEISAKGSQLMVRLASQPSLPVFPFAPDRFFYKVVDAQLTFNREGDEVVSLTLHQNGVDQVAHKR